MSSGKIAISAMLSCCLAAVAATAFAEVRINVVCPRPGVLDEAGKESGRVELADAGGVTAFSLPQRLSSIGFAGFGELGELNGDYSPDSGFGLRIR